MIVIDASAMVAALRSPEGHGAWASARLREAGRRIAAPHLLDAEVLSAIRGLRRAGSVRAGHAELLLRRYAELAMVRYPHLRLLPRAWQLRDTLTAYDALYVALAEVLDAPLVTLDGRLARAKGHRAAVLTPPA